MTVPVTKEQEFERYGALLAEAQSLKGISLGKDAWRRLRKNKVAMVALWMLVTIGSLAVLTPLLPLQSPRDVHPTDRQFKPPETQSRELGLLAKQADPEDYAKALDEQFGITSDATDAFDRGLVSLRLMIFGDWCIGSICGTDELGRDLLARLFWGARVSLMVGIVATFVSLIIGVSYGAIAGYFGGWVDDVMMRMVDVLYSIPFIFVVIFVITILGQDDVKKALEEDYGIDQIMIFFVIIGAIYWLTMSRVVRGQIISLKQEPFVEAARVIGASRPRIIFLHLVPNLLSIVIVYLTLTIPSVMLFEAFLSFLGLGVAPPDVSWGQLANEGIKGITPLKIFWWIIVFPGLALAMTLFALNFLGDGLRDALDPRMKNR